MTEAADNLKPSANTRAAITTPFASVAGSPVTKTEDRYFCRACFCIDRADYIDATGLTTCPECDSQDVILLEQRRREELAQRQEINAQGDRDADARSALAVPL